MRIGIVAGEHSGDQLAADLIASLLQQWPQATIEGIAGPRMIQAGCKPIIPMESIAFMGLTEIVKHIPGILKARRHILQYFLKNPPDVFIGVDAPDFNLTLEEKLKQKGIKTVHYVSPTVWAWRQGRLKKIKRAIDLMLTLFPFEAQFYVNHHIPVQFVGHALADRIPLENDALAARRALGLPEHATIIALMPGSRTNEIDYLADIFLKAAQQCRHQKKELMLMVPMVNEARQQQLMALWQRIAPELPLKFYIGQSHLVMQAADVILLASGTATLEAMLLKKPMVVAYRMSPLSYFIAKRLIKTDFIALPNLLAGRLLVPEFIQEKATPDALSHAVLTYLNDPQKTQTLEHEFQVLHQQLRLNASEQAAHAIKELLWKKE